MAPDLVLFAAALVGGMMNALAGGGTLVTFPALVLFGLDPRIANATSAMALWPASLGAAWGFRAHLKGSGRILTVLAPISLLGGGAGAALLLLTPSALFGRMVPWLILFATLLFAVGDRLRPATGPTPSRRWGVGAAALWGITSIYGGYFGAGMGILMLATLTLLGLSDIHRANGVKNLLGAAVNGVALATFAANGLVEWRIALLMAGGAVLGGYGASRLGQRLGRRFVRRIVVAVGCVLGAVMLWRQI